MTLPLAEKVGHQTPVVRASRTHSGGDALHAYSGVLLSLLTSCAPRTPDCSAGTPSPACSVTSPTLPTYVIVIPAPTNTVTPYGPSIPGNAPLLPAHGTQIHKRLDPEHVCVSEVLIQARQWAIQNDLGPNTLYESPTAIDIELLPREPLANVDTGSQGTVTDFEAQCMLFFEKYVNDFAKKERLRDYLRGLRLSPDSVRARDMASMGFSSNDTNHLIDHLRRFSRENDRRRTSSIYAGVLYVRVTYSFKPRSEYAITVGTVTDYKLSVQQLQLIGELERRIDLAVRCP